MNTKQKLISLINLVDFENLEVMFSERIRYRAEKTILSQLNLLLDGVILLCITHRETDLSSSFAIDVIGNHKIELSRVVFADTELPDELRRRVDGMIASLSIVDKE